MTHEDPLSEVRLVLAAKDLHASAAQLHAGALEALCVAAVSYAAAREKLRPKAPASAPTREYDLVMPFGRDKGKRVVDASTDNIEWMLARVVESLDDPAKDKFADQNRRLRAALEEELESR